MIDILIMFVLSFFIAVVIMDILLIFAIGRKERRKDGIDCCCADSCCGCTCNKR